jgi:hypothetical protein
MSSREWRPGGVESLKSLLKKPIVQCCLGFGEFGVAWKCAVLSWTRSCGCDFCGERQCSRCGVVSSDVKKRTMVV